MRQNRIDDPKLSLLRQREQEQAAKKVEEDEYKRRAMQVLMEHGVSASNSLQVSRRAGFERKQSSQSVQDVQEMINEYRDELDKYKTRIGILEQKEIERLG